METIVRNKRSNDRSRPIFSVHFVQDDGIERILAEKRAQQDRKHSRLAFAVNVPQIEEAVYSQPIEIDSYEEPTRKRGRADAFGDAEGAFGESDHSKQSKKSKTQPLPLPKPAPPQPAVRQPKRKRGENGEDDINSLPNRRPKFNPAVELPRAIPKPAVVRPKHNRTGPVTLNEARQLLGLQPGATEQQIERAFRAVSRREHPDKGGDTAYYQAILDARQILKNNLLTGRGFFDKALTNRYTQ